MVNLRTRIADLNKTTGSLKVKEICESALAQLSQINEMVTCPNAKNEIYSNVSESLANDLSKVEGDLHADKFVLREKRIYNTHNIGVKTTINKLKEADLSEYPALGYALKQFESLTGQPEYMIAEAFASHIDQFKWHPIVKESLNNINSVLESEKDSISIFRAIHNLKNSRSAYLFTGLKESLDGFILHQNETSKAALLEKLDKFTFEPLIRNLSNVIRESNNKDGFTLASKNSAIVQNIYSPVILGEGYEIFTANNITYKKTGNAVTTLSEEEKLDLSLDFTRISNFLSQDNVITTNEGITVFVRDKKIVIREDHIEVNERKLSAQDFGKVYTNIGAFRREDYSTMDNIIKTFENYNNIIEVDFAKNIQTPNIGNRNSVVMKLDENIFVSKSDPSMGSVEFFDNITATQARDMVKEFLNYDLSDVFEGILEKDQERLKHLKETKQVYIKTINSLESKLKELKALSDNPVYETSTFKDLVSTIETELDGLKEEYSEVVAEEYKEENITESHKNTTGEVPDFTAGDRVECCEGRYGTVQSVNSITNIVTIALEDGETIEQETKDVIKVKNVAESEDLIDDEELENELDLVKKTEDLKVGMSVTTKDGIEGKVKDINTTTGMVDLVADDEEGDITIKSTDLSIKKNSSDDKESDAPVKESCSVGDEIELSDGTRAMIQGISDAGNDMEELTVLTDKGDTIKVYSKEVKTINSVDGDDEIKGQQTDGSSVEIVE